MRRGARTYNRVLAKDRSVRVEAGKSELEFHDAFRSRLAFAPDHAVGRLTWEEFLHERG